MRTAYWFTGGAFATLAAIFLARACYVATMPPGTYGLYEQVTVNPVTFFLGSLVQQALAFGFVLMMHYQNATELQLQARRDSLTGALNRRSMDEEFSRLIALHARTSEPLAIMMIDVDHFKVVNDHYGHLVGDQVLRQLAALTQGTIRKQDYFARYGGEEFCILMPITTEDEAMRLAERLRQVYQDLPMEAASGVWHSTISIGVADSNSAVLTPHTLIAAADKALYTAKQSGRNRVVAFSTLE
jgi:diguanylate cyclase (GGDEF)-like protein